MANLLAHFEPPELVDFMNFIGLLIHRLQVSLLFYVYVQLNHSWRRKTCFMF